MRFPKVIRHRKAEVTIYGKKKNYPFYRIAYRVDGKRHLVNFSKYSAALKEAEKKAKDLAEGHPAVALSAAQSRDALNAFQMLESFRQQGQRISLSAIVSEFIEVSKKLGDRSLREVVESYLHTTAVLKHKSVSEAVEEFLESRKHRSETKDGKRAQLSPIYASNIRTWLNDFAATFTATALCDLSKEHLNIYIQKHKNVSTKNRNDRRATVKMFFGWAVRQDYLASNHRLFEADALVREVVESGETDFYRPEEFQKFLNNATSELRATLAIAGLAGLRIEEIMRLDWANVWRIEGHIEVTASKAKTRQRRLVGICPALAEWLKPYAGKKSGMIYPSGVNYFQENFSTLRDELKISIRRNGLRHAFCTYHFALHANENLTAQQAGNSPAMIHQHYKGLATKAEAEKWFAVMPPKSEEKNVEKPAADGPQENPHIPPHES